MEIILLKSRGKVGGIFTLSWAVYWLASLIPNSNHQLLNSFQTSSEELVNKLKAISSWNGRPLYIPKVLLKAIAPLGDIYKFISNNTPLLCSESARVLTHGHKYEGLKAKENLNIQYTNVDEFIKKTINWLIEENYISLSKI